MKNLETGLNYARLNHVYPGNHEPSWVGAYIWCLRHNDYESAELIRDRNRPLSDECDDREHDECHLLWCGCSCHQFEMAPVVGKPLRSCAEVWEEEAEFA